jgi:hypothetical protein
MKIIFQLIIKILEIKPRFRKLFEQIYIEKAFKDFSFFKTARGYLPRKNYL